MTIKDIARLSGVSVSTVSRYLNDGSVSYDASEKIKEVIAENNYSPSISAQRLRGRSNAVMIIVNRIKSPTASSFLDSIIKRLFDKNYIPSIYLSGGNKGKRDQYIKLAQTNNYEHVILFSDSEEIKTRYKNIVIVGQKSKQFPSIYCDGKDVLEKLVMQVLLKNNNLIDEIVIVAIEILDIQMLKRVEGIQKIANDVNIKISYLIFNDFEKNDIQINDFSNKCYFVCITDQLAVNVYNQLNKMNKKISEDYIISGYGNYELSEHLEMTTVQIDEEDQTSKVITAMEQKDILAQKVDYEIIIRKSTTFE